MMEGCFANILMMLSADPTCGYCGSKFYWILESNTIFLSPSGYKARPERVKSFADLLGHFRGFP